MAKSALLKSSIAKKYWMALTGLFLCLFLVGHLAGNLQLIFGTPLQFNQYALFMTTNPAVKILSYLTYLSILFHAVDGFVLTFQNRKARPVGYAKSNPSANSSFSSRNMAVLGTLVLLFIATHMTNFWAKMHFSTMPLQTITVDNGDMVSNFYITSSWGQDRFINVNQVDGQNVVIEGNGFYYTKPIKIQFAEGYKDLYKITIEFFRSNEKLFGVIPNEGLFFTIFYVLSMAVLGFHLWHGFQSAFQSLGVIVPNGLR